ncbi:MAG TPA: hypothetical protein VGB44_01005 [Flavobacterium sp.]
MQHIWELRRRKIFSVLLLSALFIVLLFALVTPQLFDSYLYHINGIQWNYIYRAVPGLANFHDRFGFNSSILVLSAGFSYLDIFHEFLFIISSLSYYIFFIWVINIILIRKDLTGLFALLFLYYFTLQYSNDISSPGSDLLSNLLIGYLLMSLLFRSEQINKTSLTFIIIPIFCMTIKLSVAPIGLLVLFAIAQRRGLTFAAIKELFVFGSFLFMPWIIRNIILSGYVLFPVQSLAFPGLDWQVNKETTTELTNVIKAWARIPGPNYHEVLKLPFAEWFIIWWKAATTVNKIFFILAAISPLTFGFYCWLTRKKEFAVKIWVFIIAYAIFILWFSTAPDFRFAFGIILILALSPLLILEKLVQKIKIIFAPVLFIVFLYCLFIIGEKGVGLFKTEFTISNVESYLYKPQNIALIKIKKEIEFKENHLISSKNEKLILYSPKVEWTQCYDKFPCTWHLGNIELRGETIQEGFRSR